MAQNKTEWWKQVPEHSGWMSLAGLIWLFVAVLASSFSAEPTGLIVFLVVVMSFVPVFFVWQFLTWKAKDEALKGGRLRHA
jgi:hypothetical protein